MKLHPNQQFIITNISSQTNSVLEVGCSNGDNLRIISSLFPNIYIAGFDPKIQKPSYSKVVLLNGSAPAFLKRYKDKSFDLVFTSAVLMYISPRKIKETIAEIFRVGKHVLFIEQDGSKLSFLDRLRVIMWRYRNFGNYKRHYHLYNYEALLKSLGVEAKISRLPFTWGDKFWDKYGTAISK